MLNTDVMLPSAAILRTCHASTTGISGGNKEILWKGQFWSAPVK